MVTRREFLNELKKVRLDNNTMKEIVLVHGELNHQQE